MPVPLRRLPSLDDEQARAAAALAAAARARRSACPSTSSSPGPPGELHLLQCRPITTLEPRSRRQHDAHADPGAPTTTAAPGFPVAWQQHPDDAKLFWQHDPMHFPDPLAPMEAAMLQRTLGPGFGYGARRLRRADRARRGPRGQRLPLPGDGPRAGDPGGDGRAGAARRAGDPGRRRPPRRAVGRARSCPRSASTSTPGSASTSRAPRAPSSSPTSTTTWTRLARVWELHFVTSCRSTWRSASSTSSTAGSSRDSGPLDSYRLLEGLPNMTVEVGQELWQLSRRALAATRSAACSRIVAGRRRAGRARGERRGPRVPRGAAGLPRSATGAARTSGRSPRRAGPRTRRRRSRACATSPAARTPTRPA